MEMKCTDCLIGHGYICKPLRKVSEVVDKNFDKVEEALNGSGDDPSENYLTQEQADGLYQKKGSYVSPATLEEYQKLLKEGVGIEITEDNTINVTLDTKVFEPVSELPAVPTDEQKNKILLVPSSTPESGNACDEYVWLVDGEHPDGYWEKFGSANIDLSGYLKSAEAEKLYQPRGDYAPAAPADDAYAHMSDIPAAPDLSPYLKITEVNGKKVVTLPFDVQIMGTIDEAIYAIASLRKYAQSEGADVIQVEIGTTSFHLNLNSVDDVTVDTPSGKKTLATTDVASLEKDGLMSKADKAKLDEINADEIPWRIDIPVRGTQFNKVFEEETILSEWFHVASSVDLKQLILKKQLVEVYGITLTGKPMYYRMPVHYAAFESNTQVKLVWVGLDTSNDMVAKYTCLINLDGTVIENGCNVQLTLKTIEV